MVANLPHSDLSQPLVLIVDDDAGNRYLLGRALRSAGFELREATTGAEGLAAIAQAPPDLVVLDVRLPDVSGFEICRRLKAGTATRHVPILQVSAERISNEDQVFGLEQGADGYLTHPIDPAVLVATARSLLRIRQTEQALTHSEVSLRAEKDRLAVTLDSIGDGVITANADGAVELMNPVAQRLTGWTQTEAGGRRLREVFKFVDEATRETLAYDGGDNRLQHGVLLARDGSECFIEGSIAPIRGQGDAVAGQVLVFRDVSERRRLEAGLVRAQKLESLGVLAGGIAHDFNNMLTAVLGNISLARLPDIEPDPLLEEAEKACLRARGLTNQLLTFAKGGAPIKRTTALDTLLTDAVGFALRGSSVQCVFDIAADLKPVEVDVGQITQVVNNLVLNAIEAMPAGGTVRVEARNSLAPPANSGLPAGAYVSFAVIDQGIGIPPNHLARIFDPYFTTKKRGSGLGLAVVYSIVEKHGGTIDVTSSANAGSRFMVYLPASTQRLAQAAAAPEWHAARGSGNILIMDDEEAILRFASKALGEMGYRVKTARDGRSALEAFEQAQAAGTPFDAVILDLTVPGGMGGRECLTSLRRLAPNVAAIAASGYSTDPIMCEPRRFGFSAVVAKPYLPQELSRIITEVLPN